MSGRWLRRFDQRPAFRARKRSVRTVPRAAHALRRTSSMKTSLLACVTLASAVALLDTGRAEACGGCFVQPTERTVVTDHRMALSISTTQVCRTAARTEETTSTLPMPATMPASPTPVTPTRVLPTAVWRMAAARKPTAAARAQVSVRRVPLLRMLYRRATSGSSPRWSRSPSPTCTTPPPTRTRRAQARATPRAREAPHA